MEVISSPSQSFYEIKARFDSTAANAYAVADEVNEPGTDLESLASLDLEKEIAAVQAIAEMSQKIGFGEYEKADSPLSTSRESPLETARVPVSEGKFGNFSHVSSKLDYQTVTVTNGKYDKKRLSDIESQRRKPFAHGPAEGLNATPQVPSSPSKRYEGVSSKLHDATNATKNWQYIASPQKEEKPFVVGMPHSEGLPVPPVIRSKKYQDASSKLFQPTKATLHHQYTEENCNVDHVSPFDLPLVPAEKSKKYADVESKLYAETEAIKHQRYDESRKEKLNENKVKHFVAGTSVNALDTSPKPIERTEKYNDVKSKLHELTAAVVHGCYDDEKASKLRCADKYKPFAVGLTGHTLDSALKPFEKSEKYGNVKSKLHEATTAAIVSRAEPSVPLEDKETNILWATYSASGLDSPVKNLPSTASNDYWKSHVTSKLMEPTASSTSWECKSLSVGSGKSTSSSESPTRKSFAAGLANGILDQQPRQVTTVKTFDHVTSKIFKDTVASQACQYTTCATSAEDQPENIRWISTWSAKLDETPVSELPHSPMKQYSHIKARLSEETAASIHHHYDISRRDSLSSAGKEARFDTSMNSSSESPSRDLPPSPIRWRSESRLHEPTVATIAGAYDAHASKENSRSGSPTLEDSSSRRWSVSSSKGELYSPPKPFVGKAATKSYTNVPSKLLHPTAATTGGRYDAVGLSTDLEATGKPDRIAAKTGLYEHVESRLHQPTKATTRGSIAKKTVDTNSTITSESIEWVQTSRHAKLELFTLNENCPSSPNKKYKNVSSKLYAPTIAAINGRYVNPSREQSVNDPKCALDDIASIMHDYSTVSEGDAAGQTVENETTRSVSLSSQQGFKPTV